MSDWYTKIKHFLLGIDTEEYNKYEKEFNEALLALLEVEKEEL